MGENVVDVDFSKIADLKLRKVRADQFARLLRGELPLTIEESFKAWLRNAKSEGLIDIDPDALDQIAPPPPPEPEASDRPTNGEIKDKTPLTDWCQPTRCKHLGEVIAEDRVCQLCGKRGVLYAVRKCALHGECSERKRSNKVPNCLSCDDHVPLVRFISKPDVRLTSPSDFQKTKPITGFLRSGNGSPADHLQDLYRGAAVFLLCGGPSLAGMPTEKLRERGIVTAGVNNASAVHRTDLAFMVDSPIRFHRAMWQDPRVMKFSRVCVATDELRTRTKDGHMVGTGLRANDMPNTFFYRVSNFFTAQNFLDKPIPAWQCEWSVSESRRHVKRSVMLVAIRMLYWLGFRTVFLLGADFHYRAGKTYGFPGCDKAAAACGTNNTAMGVLRHWFETLRPEFERRGFHVYNCTPGSKLTAFDRVDFADALDLAAWNSDVDTTGLYGN